MRRQNPTPSSYHFRPPLHLGPHRCEAGFNAGASAWISAEITANSFFSILFFKSLRAFKSSSPHYSRLPPHLLYIVLSCLFLHVYTFLFIVFPLPPVHIILTFLRNSLLACTVVMFSSSFSPPLEKSTYLSYWQILGLSSIAPYFVYPLVHLQEISQNSLFRVSLQRLLFLIILLFSRFLDFSPLHPRLLSSNGPFSGENSIRILRPHSRINDSFKDQLKIMQRSFLD